MYPYYQQWYNYWSRVPQNPSYHPAFQNFYQNQGDGWNYNGYPPAMYAYQYPYMHSYDYTGYTENGNVNPTSFNAGSIPKTFMNYFQDEEGQLDLDKMMSTTGQMVKTVQQVSPIVKGIGSFVKGIK